MKKKTLQEETDKIRQMISELDFGYPGRGPMARVGGKATHPEYDAMKQSGIKIGKKIYSQVRNLIDEHLEYLQGSVSLGTSEQLFSLYDGVFEGLKNALYEDEGNNSPNAGAAPDERKSHPRSHGGDVYRGGEWGKE